MVYPTPNGLVRDRNAAFCQQVFTYRRATWVHHGVPINRNLIQIARAIEDKDRKSDAARRTTSHSQAAYLANRAARDGI
jgi:hypothetical protein